ncbi:RNA polymerase sigma factor [Streptomyces sp. ME19-01-6]|uniref:RNA polymerase sigma factor n=1 Tax=Streptomyces sp. ME19-01-6 TaxID=3028686 RepID=UPI0029A5D843|nr:sigma factor [Streptomyces sp. ME19-01-6]MDX3227075.1 sigma factor [Streptomyces sp. ME19-01-6]
MEERGPLIPERAAAPERRTSRAAPPRPDAAGFAAFYEENFDAVLGFVTRRTACPQVAADLTADIFVAALEASGQYDPRRGAPTAWLYGLTPHEAAQALGLNQATVRVRLHRAKRALRAGRPSITKHAERTLEVAS